MTLQEQTEFQMCEASKQVRLQIAIDGPAASGKSTIARRLAETLQCTFLDTGLMYRALTYLALQNEIPLDDEQSLVRLAAATTFQTSDTVQDSILVDGAVLGSCLRAPAIDAVVSEVSAMPRVRAALVQRQREIADDTCIIMVGRDIGTVVLPDADVKIWVTASAEARARRRFEEKLASSSDTIETVRAEIDARDSRDANREYSPLMRPTDAIDVCTDETTISESVHQALEGVRETLTRSMKRSALVET